MRCRGKPNKETHPIPPSSQALIKSFAYVLCREDKGNIS